MTYFDGEAYESALLSWLRDKAGLGFEALKREKPFNEIQNCINYVNGEQQPLRSRALSYTFDNRLKKIVLETVSALTDVRPVWNYETSQDKLKPQAETLNKLARAWWRNNKIDRALQSVLAFSCVGGSGYGALVWNAEEGDFDLIPYDPRDVCPIDPVFSDSIQDWRGVMLRQRLPIDQVRKEFPTKAHLVGKDAGSWFGSSIRGGAAKPTDLLSTMWSIMRGGATKSESVGPTDTTDIVRCYFKDDTIWDGEEPRQVGDPDSNWGYVVYPIGFIKPDGKPATKEDARMYPRGRLVICTPDAILLDGPNPYWHGYFPVIRFTLDPLPWSLLGSSMVLDLLPLQNGLNETLRGMEDGIAQWVRRNVKADKGSVSKNELEKIDPRKGGQRIHLNPSAGSGFEFIDGPMLPEWYMKMPEFYISQMDDNSGVRGLQQLSQLKQMPAADTVEQFMEALSPLLRLRGRSLETSLAELAEMFKVGVLQYYNTEQRKQFLGEDGVTLEGYEYQPSSILLPAVQGGETEYERSIKSIAHARNFAFSIAPNSFLNVSHATQKMLILQLFRSNGIDIYTTWEAMDLPNVGPMPAETLPERLIYSRKMGLQAGPTPELVQAQTAAAVMQAQGAILQVQQAMALGATPGGGPGAQAPQAGGPPGSNPVGPVSNNGSGPQGGRPPSGQQVPRPIQKSGPEGTRMVISESGR